MYALKKQIQVWDIHKPMLKIQQILAMSGFAHKKMYKSTGIPCQLTPNNRQKYLQMIASILIFYS